MCVIGDVGSVKTMCFQRCEVLVSYFVSDVISMYHKLSGIWGMFMLYFAEM